MEGRGGRDDGEEGQREVREKKRGGAPGREGAGEKGGGNELEGKERVENGKERKGGKRVRKRIIKSK